jgi:hypothetical protein
MQLNRKIRPIPRHTNCIECNNSEAANNWQQQLSQTAALLSSLIEEKKKMEITFEARERLLLEEGNGLLAYKNKKQEELCVVYNQLEAASLDHSKVILILVAGLRQGGRTEKNATGARPKSTTAGSQLKGRVVAAPSPMQTTKTTLPAAATLTNS